MTDRLITANASKVTGAEFFRAVFGPPKMSREEDGERALAWFECQEAMLAAPKGRDAYWARKAHSDECSARYAARLREIAAKYALVEVEHLGPGRIAT